MKITKWLSQNSQQAALFILHVIDYLNKTSIKSWAHVLFWQHNDDNKWQMQFFLMKNKTFKQIAETKLKFKSVQKNAQHPMIKDSTWF